MKQLIVAAALALAAYGCTSAGGGGGPGPTPTPPIPSGIFYVNQGTGTTNTVGAFSTSQIAGGGQLSPLPGSPFQVTGQNGASGAPFGIALASAIGALYVVNSDQKSVSHFTVKADGTLTYVASNPVGTGASGVCVDPSDKFAAVVNTTDSSVQPFAVNPDGSLTAALLAAGNGLNAPIACTYSADSKYLYVTNFAGGTGGISGFLVGVGGALTKLPSSPYDPGHNLQGIVATPTTVFAADMVGNGLQVLVISLTGDLVTPSAFATDAGPIGLALAPNGRDLYVAASGKRAVDGYTVNGQSLTALSGSPYPTNANETAMISVNSAGNLLVALDELDLAVTVFTVKADGTLGFAPSNEYVFTNGGKPTAIVAK